MKPEDAQRIIRTPLVTEKTFEMVEKENRLTFLVDPSSTKRSIREALELLYEVRVMSVNTVSSMAGKKAYVRLAAESSATDLATKLGLV